MFLLNNTFIQGLHCVVGAEYLNTMSNGAVCTVVFSFIVAIISWIFSLPRTFSTLSKVATLSAFFTFISVVLAATFAAVEDHPAGYTPALGEPIVLVIPAKGTSFVKGMNAFLNISYTFIGQITLPSFIAEMKEPRDFWKSVTAVTIAEIIVFSVVGAVTYVYVGNQYMISPAFGSIGDDVFKKVSFSFMIPTIIFLGVLYASVSARFIFFRLFEGTRHKGNNTVVGWAAWGGILAALWLAAFIIAEVIPFFSGLLSIMSSLFDSFFGFIFWGTAYIRMRSADHGPRFFMVRGIRGWVGFIFNVFLIFVGFFFLGPGTYVSHESLVRLASACLVLVLSRSLANTHIPSRLLLCLWSPATRKAPSGAFSHVLAMRCKSLQGGEFVNFFLSSSSHQDLLCTLPIGRVIDSGDFMTVMTETAMWWIILTFYQSSIFGVKEYPSF